MDMDERMKKAKKELSGVKVRIVKAGGKKRKCPAGGRRVSTFVKGDFKNGETKKAKYMQCGKKIRYRSEHDARMRAGNARTKRGIELRVYLCPICDGWHLTKRAPENRAEGENPAPDTT